MTAASIDAGDLLRRMGSSSDGAALAFEGRVRDLNLGRRVSGLDYEAYREMADRELGEIAAEAADRFDISSVGVRHRVGSLKPREVSLVVVVVSEHRDPAFAASRYVIEELKQRLPVWKRERYADGSEEWLAPGRGHGPGSESTP